MKDSNTNLYFFKSFRMKIEPSDKIYLKVSCLSGNYLGRVIEENITAQDFNFNSISFTTQELLELDSKVKIEISTKKFFKRWKFEVEGKVIRSFLSIHETGEINYGVKIEKQTQDSELYYFLKDFIHSCSTKRITNYFMFSALSKKEHTSREGIEFFSLLISLYKQISNVDLQNIINVSTEFLNAKEGRIYKINIKNDKLETFKHSLDSKALKQDFRENKIGQTFTSGQLINIQSSHSQDESNNSLLAIPIENRKKQRIGVIEFKGKNDGHFSLKDELCIKHISQIISLYFKDYLPHSKLTQVVQLNPLLKDDYFYIGKSKSAKLVQRSLRSLKSTNANILIVGEKGLGKHYFAESFLRTHSREESEENSIDCLDKLEIKKCIETNFQQYKIDETGTFIIYNIERLEEAHQYDFYKLLEHSKKRIITTSRTDLELSVQYNNFNKKLYKLLSKSYIHLPPLRNRREDIIYMANYFLKNECEKREIDELHFSPQALRNIIDYTWPGNIDELEKKIKKQILLCQHNHDNIDRSMEKQIEISFTSKDQDENTTTISADKTQLYDLLKSIANISDLSLELRDSNEIVNNILKKVS